MRLLGPRVFLISGSLLAFEVILLRLFAVQTFHHFAYMAIGVALLGFAAAGTALVLARGAVEGRETELFRILSVLLPLTLVAAPVLGQLMDFEPTQFLWDWRPWATIAVLYVCLALPFVVGAGAVTLALMRAGASVGRLYAWNMVGSGFGGLLAIGLLFPFRPDQALAATVLPTLPGAVAAILELVSSRSRAGARPVAAWSAAGLLCAGVILAVVRPPWTLSITSFKGLPQVEAFAGATRVGEAWGPTGWVTAVRTPAFHHAPGLSLGFQGELPEQVALFVDAETAGGATVLDGRVGGAAREGDGQRVGGVTAGDGDDLASTSFLDWLPSAAPYALGPARSVLVLGSGDGLQALNALAHGAERVTAVELVEPLVRLADEVVEEESQVYSHPSVRTVVGDARGFAARTDERFDLVVLTASGTFAAGASGIHGTGENYLETVEAYRRYLELLEPGGMLAVTRWLRTPPRDNVKLIFTVDEALRRSGSTAGQHTTAFLRSWATGTLLVRPDGFERSEIDRLRSFATPRLFDVDWPVDDGGPVDPGGQVDVVGPVDVAGQVDPGRQVDPGGQVQHNLLERPVFREALRATARGEDAAVRFRSEYAFDVSPATDDRPYFGQFVRLASLPTLLAEDRAAWLPVAEWGYLAVVATLVQSGLLALLLLGLPVVVLAGSRGKDVRIGRTALYFGAIGFGFMFVELAVIQRLGLVLGHPVFATSATLVALLVFSGLGSAGSDRLPVRYTTLACAAVAASALALGLGSGAAEALVSLPLWARAAAALAVLAVPGVLMGVPFPMGLRTLAPESTGLAWAWAANGVASVMGASAATLLAMELGGSGLLMAGSACYVVAAGLVWRGRASYAVPPVSRSSQ